MLIKILKSLILLVSLGVYCAILLYFKVGYIFRFNEINMNKLLDILNDNQLQLFLHAKIIQCICILDISFKVAAFKKLTR